jgi:hypothetical protein
MTTKLNSALKAIALTLAIGSVTVGLSACASRDAVTQTNESKGWFGLGKSRNSSSQNDTAGIGVNAYLWRASLDTLSFMPLAAADPWGGVIMTDWYVDPQRPNERFKATVYILDTRLRADALSVSVFKEVNAAGNWQAADVSAQTQLDIQNAILSRAREIRLSDVKN